MPKTPQASLITNKSNIAYLSGFTGSAGYMLLTKSTKYLFTDFRYIERAKNTIKKGIKTVDISKIRKNPEDIKKHWQSVLKKHRIKSIGVEEEDLTVTKYKNFKKLFPRVRLINISGKIEKKRELKNRTEIRLTAKSQQINEKVFLEIKKFVQRELKKSRLKTLKITELDLAWKIKQMGNEFGAEDVSFNPIVAFGKHSALPHHDPTKTKLKKGDIILIDMGMKYKGYCSDMTRMIFTEKPTPFQKEIYNTVLKAQETCINGLKAGISGAKADSLARKVIEAAAYGEQYGHSGGHGVGLDIHEIPNLAEKYKKKLK
ncbi:aminopeptidase P family protein, partial [Candidatus Peregrinibacteria bacterium]|nr:aminopeptidase P family protein [Candidatus Peregrinibacteria bacterium]